jgi:hypothetical protein
MRRVLENEWLTEVQTVKGFDIPFNPSDFKHVIGIVIIDLVGEENFPRVERTRFLTDYLHMHNMPIHILMRDDFDLISSEIDTLPDFTKFLSTREQLNNKGLFLLPVPVLDFLAIYKTQPEIIEKALSESINLNFGEGLWDEYQERFSADIIRRNELNKPSSLSIVNLRIETF